MAEPASALFDRYKAGLTGVELSHSWRGHGSAIFFEFGRLTPTRRRRRDGSAGNPQGEFGVMIECSWRVERGTSIVFGSWSDDELWEAGLGRLRGATVTDLLVFGRLPELQIELSDGHRVLSFMTADGGPEWALFDRRTARAAWLCVRDGLVVEEFAVG